MLTAPEGGLTASSMLLDEASVTGTGNIIMAAAYTPGRHHYLQCSLRAIRPAIVPDAPGHGCGRGRHRLQPAPHHGREAYRRHHPPDTSPT